MPYPSQIDLPTLIATAAEMIEREGGAEKVSLAKLAGVFGVKAPSLYRHVKNKEDLLRAVNYRTQEALTEACLAATEIDATSAEKLIGLARAYRAFALAHPITYQLAYTDYAVPDDDALEALGVRLQEVIAELTAEGDSLTALRSMWAFLHGFALLELNNRFRREGGSLDDVFADALAAWIRGWG